MDINANKDLISKLKFIGKIQIGDKVSVKNMAIQPDGYFTQFSRSILQDNRNKTLVFLQDTFFKTFELLRCYEKSKKKSDKLICINIINDLKSSKNGLLNLKETYIDDIKFSCDIDVLIQIIDAKLSEIEDSNYFSPLSISSSPSQNINSLSPTLFPPPPPIPELNLSSNEEGDDI